MLSTSTGPPDECLAAGEASTSLPVVSFVVVAYNEEANIARCLAAIAGQAEATPCEVVVVDDGSSDRTAEVAAGCLPASMLQIVRHQRNRGRGAARASGVAAARGQWVAMVDADIVIPPHWLEYCLAEMLAGGWDAVGGIPVPDGDCTFIYNRFGLDAKAVRPTIAVSGTNGLYRREVFEQVAIDSTLTEGEDVALNHAISRSGLRLRTLMDLQVEHAESKGFSRSACWLYESGQGASRQFVRYGQVRVPDLATAGQVGACLAAAVLYARGRRSPKVLAIPGVYLMTAAFAHLSSKFNLRSRPGRVLGAWAADTVLLGSYFAGRLAGLPKAFTAWTAQAPATQRRTP